MGNNWRGLQDKFYGLKWPLRLLAYVLMLSSMSLLRIYWGEADKKHHHTTKYWLLTIVFIFGAWIVLSFAFIGVVKLIIYIKSKKDQP